MFVLPTILQLPSLDAFAATMGIASVRALVECSATLLIGILAAAGLRVAGGYPAIASWLDEAGSLRRTFRLILAGLCVPVCALGVIPMVQVLHDSGMPRRDVVTLWIAAPLFNPFSLLYAVSILPVWQCLVLYAAATMLIVIVSEVAARFDQAAPTSSDQQLQVGNTGTSRVWNVMIAAGQIASGKLIVFILLGLIVNGAVISFLSPASFELIASYHNQAGPVEAAMLTLPQLISPITFVMASSAIHDTHLSFACAISLFLAGVSWSGVTFFAMRSMLGTPRTLALLLVSFVLTASVSFASQTVMAPSVGEEEETHGMDTLARPYHASLSTFHAALSQQIKHTGATMQGGLMLLGCLVGWGVIIRVKKLEFRQDASPIETAGPPSRFNIRLSAGQIGITAATGAAITVVAVMYMLFPGAEESFAEMQKIQADAVVAVRQNNPSLAARKLDEWDAIAAKLPIGWMLRFSLPDDRQTAAIRQLRTTIWEVRNSAASMTAEDAKSHARSLLDQFTKCRAACLGDSP